MPKDRIAVITQENLLIKKRLDLRGKKMTDIFREIRSAVTSAESAASFSVTRILQILVIARVWYYRRLDPNKIQDRRFNLYAVRDEEWIVVGYKKAHPKLGFRELAYAMIDEDIAYLSPSSFHNTEKT